MIYESFSESQKKVADKLLEGKTNDEIAVELGLAIQTVKFHTTRLFLKSGVKNCRQFLVKLLTEKFNQPTPHSILEEVI